jgi:acetyl-CoA carboxylase carboxyl transferase subunit alpha
MTSFVLDFEKPLAELQKQIEELQAQSDGGADLSAEINSLTERLNKMQEDIHASLTPWQRVQLARHPQRPHVLDFVEQLFTEFMELSGDRRFKDDKAVVGGFAKFNGSPVMVIGTQKGRDMKDNMMRNFGWPNPEGYRKAMRLMRLADRANVPIITFIDTPGAFPGVSSEERHIAEAIAVNLRDMFSLKVPVICVIIGEGGSGGALGIGVGNRLLIMENAYYSVITPEGCAAILWKDRAFAPQAAEALNLTAQKLIELKVADEIVMEPLGGAHSDPAAAIAEVGSAIAENLKHLSKIGGEELKKQRYEKFRAMGTLFIDTVPAEPKSPSRKKAPAKSRAAADEKHRK